MIDDQPVLIAQLAGLAIFILQAQQLDQRGDVAAALHAQR